MTVAPGASVAVVMECEVSTARSSLAWLAGSRSSMWLLMRNRMRPGGMAALLGGEEPLGAAEPLAAGDWPHAGDTALFCATSMGSNCRCSGMPAACSSARNEAALNVMNRLKTTHAIEEMVRRIFKVYFYDFGVTNA